MSDKKDKRSEIPAETHRQAEVLARELFRPINRPSAGQGQDEVEDEISLMGKKPKPGKKGKELL